MARKLINKVNNRPRGSIRNNNFLLPSLRRFLFNVLIKLYFNYAYSARYPNLTNKKELHHRGCLKYFDRKWPFYLSQVFEAVLESSLSFTLSSYHKLVQLFPNQKSAKNVFFIAPSL